MANPIHPPRSLFPWAAGSRFFNGYPSAVYLDPAGGLGAWQGPTGWGQPRVGHYDLLSHLRDVAARDYPPPSPFYGPGVVFIGGGAYWPMVVASIHMLRRVNKTLPVEVWHRGAYEPVDRRMLAGLGDVRVWDAEAHARKHGDTRVLGGWETKWYAVANSQFDTVLYLDADAYVVSDPEPLLNSVHESGEVAWWSEPTASDPNVKWREVWPDAAGDPPVNFQGGQFLVNRTNAAAWRWVMTTHWMCQHSDYYFYDRCVMGDQDCARVAMAAAPPKRRYLGYTPYTPPAYVCRVDGVPTVVHRVEDKRWLRPNLPNELDFERAWAATVGSMRG